MSITKHEKGGVKIAEAIARYGKPFNEKILAILTKLSASRGMNSLLQLDLRPVGEARGCKAYRVDDDTCTAIAGHVVGNRLNLLDLDRQNTW